FHMFCLCTCHVRVFVLPRSPITPLPVVFSAPAPTQIYTLSLHDALPICPAGPTGRLGRHPRCAAARAGHGAGGALASSRSRASGDRKSTRLNSSHVSISYAVFCLKKQKGEHEALSTYYCSLSYTADARCA